MAGWEDNGMMVWAGVGLDRVHERGTDEMWCAVVSQQGQSLVE